MKKILISLLAFIMAFAPAESGLADEVAVAVKANFSSQTICFEVSQSVTATAGAEEPTNLSITPFTVKNNMSMGSIDVTNIRAEGQNGYSVVEDSSESWKELAFDTKKLSILATVDSAAFDLSGDGFSGCINIPRESSVEILLSGHTAAASATVSGIAAANIITTVALHVC